MKSAYLLCSSAMIALSSPLAAVAQDGPDATAGTTQVGPDGKVEIVVTGESRRGRVDTIEAPVLELNAEEIAAYGADSIADLVAALEPETSSSRGRGGPPVFLINGVRIGSFREFRSYPSEAIEKVEVLPEEVAQKLGFPPDRRVVNFILKENYSAITLETEFEQPSRGGYSVNEQEATLLKISRGGRINANAERRKVTALTEAERDIIQTDGSISDVASDPDPAAFRTLIAESEQYEGSLNYAKALLGSGSSLSINGTYNRNESLSLSGLDTVLLTNPANDTALRVLNEADPLARRSVTDTFSTSGSYDMPLGDYRLNATFNGSLSEGQTEIERQADLSGLIADAAAGTLAIDGPLPQIPDAGFDIAESTNYAFDSKLTFSGSPVLLPAGELSTTFDVGYNWSKIESSDTRSATQTDLSRSTVSAGVNVSIPLTSSRELFWDDLGSFTLNGQLRINDISDFGTLRRLSAGLNWQPFDGLDLQATYTNNEAAPSLSQLGSPQIVSFNVPYFDLANNTTELVTVTSGGNPDLLAEKQSDWTFSANMRLPFWNNVRFRVAYSTNRSDNVSSSFPFLSEEIEAAFPDRVTRDAGGRLLAVDLRPVDFFETRTERLNFGLNFNGTIGKAPERRGPPPGMSAGAGAGGGRSAGAGGPPAQTGQPASGAAQSTATETAKPAADGTTASQETASPTPQAGPPRGPRGPGSAMPDERRQRFAAFRDKVCADDGEAFLTRVIDAVDKGEKLEELPDFDPERAGRMIQRLRNEDGTLNTERLAGFRTMMCNREGGPAPAAGAEGGSSGEARQGGQSGRPAGRRGGRRGGPAAFFGGGGDTRARYFVSLNHSLELNREVLISPVGPQLDLLDGDTLTSTGTPRNTTRLEAGIFKSGMGMRLSGRYTGPARVNGSGQNSTDLFVDDLARFDIRLFTNLGEVLKKEDGLFKDLRVSFRIDNVFDGRRLVKDSNGDTPLGFQPLLIDPTGRYVGIDIRKLF